MSKQRHLLSNAVCWRTGSIAQDSIISLHTACSVLHTTNSAFTHAVRAAYRVTTNGAETVLRCVQKCNFGGHRPHSFGPARYVAMLEDSTTVLGRLIQSDRSCTETKRSTAMLWRCNPDKLPYFLAQSSIEYHLSIFIFGYCFGSIYFADIQRSISTCGGAPPSGTSWAHPNLSFSRTMTSFWI